MSKFIFKLQPILNLKKQMEDNIKNDLGKAFKKLEDEKSALSNLQEEKESCINTVNAICSKVITVKTIKDFSKYISYLGDNVLLQKKEVNLAENNVDRVREDLLFAVKERRILEKLKEKKLEEYKEQQLIEEHKVNDEIVSFKSSSLQS